MLAKTFLAASCIFISSCDGLPLVTIHQLDTAHNIANPMKVAKWDEVNCVMVIEEQDPFPIIGPELHGGFAITAKDAAKLKAEMQAQCKIKNEEKATIEALRGENKILREALQMYKNR